MIVMIWYHYWEVGGGVWLEEVSQLRHNLNSHIMSAALSSFPTSQLPQSEQPLPWAPVAVIFCLNSGPRQWT